MLLVVANYNDSDMLQRVSWVVGVLDDHEICSLTVLTHSANRSEHPWLKARRIAHVCIDNYTAEDLRSSFAKMYRALDVLSRMVDVVEGL